MVITKRKTSDTREKTKSPAGKGASAAEKTGDIKKEPQNNSERTHEKKKTPRSNNRKSSDPQQKQDDRDVTPDKKKKTTTRRKHFFEAYEEPDEKPQESIFRNAVPIRFVFAFFLFARICAALFSIISDCDETYNYWEPTHYILYDRGMQTWEYSPKYALRSYAYIMLHVFPAFILKMLNVNPMYIFYFIRLCLGLTCAVAETYFYKGVLKQFGKHVARFFFFFQLLSPGMFVASTAYLPSSFSMYFSSMALAAFYLNNMRLSIFFVAVSSILGWPFTAILGLPIVVHCLFRTKQIKWFFDCAFIFGLTLGVPTIIFDFYYYGKLVITPWNIIKYNIFSEHGPALYGVTPWPFYIINCFLNFNISFLLALYLPVALLKKYIFLSTRPNSNTPSMPYWLSVSPTLYWFIIFSLQPHKEERFLYPIYMMITLCGAISLNICAKFVCSLFQNFKQISIKIHYLDGSKALLVWVSFIYLFLSLSRIFAQIHYYHAPITLMREFNQKMIANGTISSDVEYDFCVQKDWYRFPTHFFFPSNNFKLRFVESDFEGHLPKYFSDQDNGTQIEDSYFNNRNRENRAAYFPIDGCDFMFDFDRNFYSNNEPDYKLFNQWQVFSKTWFIVSEESIPIYRAFFVFGMNEYKIVYEWFYIWSRDKSVPLMKIPPEMLENNKWRLSQ